MFPEAVEPVLRPHDLSEASGKAASRCCRQVCVPSHCERLSPYSSDRRLSTL